MARRSTARRRAPRRVRRSPRRRKASLSLPPAVRGALSKVLVACLGVLVVVNGVVRHVGGGDVHPLSLSRMADKTRAVALLAGHYARHPFSADEQDPAAAVAGAARTHGISPHFALSVARTESSLRPHAISATGAMGLMQLMPDTAKAYGAADPFDPVQNADAATRFLKDLLRRYRGDRHRVLAAYNAGPGRVPRTGPYQLPAETRSYVAKVLE